MLKEIFPQKYLLRILRQKQVLNRSASKKQVINVSASQLVWFLELLACYIMLQQHINEDIKRHKIIGRPHTNLQDIALFKQQE